MNAPERAIEMLEDEPAGTLALQPVNDSPRQLAAVTAPQTSDDFMLAAMHRGFTPEQISQMMDLRDRQDRHVAEKAFRQDFAAFRGENVIIPKTRHVDRGRGGSFVQAEYHVAANLLSPALSRHGFGFRHDQRFGSRKWTTEGVESDIPWVYVTCFLEHRAGHSEKLELEGPPGDLSVNTPVQNMQVTASLLKRQSLLAITGTATGGEDDENKLRRHQPDDGADSEGDALMQAGRDASLEGMKALAAWWGGLSKTQRDGLQKEYPALRRAAQQVDQEAGRA